VTGGVAGVIRNSPPLLFALGSSIQWFGLGATYWGALLIFKSSQALLTISGTRSFIFQAWDTGKGLTKGDKVSASTVAGGVAGSGVGLLTRESDSPFPCTYLMPISRRSPKCYPWCCHVLSLWVPRSNSREQI
jgi:hypothetical protein